MFARIGTKFIIYILGGLLLSGALTASYFGWRSHQRTIGWNAALAKVAEQNATARKVVDNIITSIDACEAAGGSWNVSTGDCDR